MMLLLSAVSSNAREYSPLASDEGLDRVGFGLSQHPHRHFTVEACWSFKALSTLNGIAIETCGPWPRLHMGGGVIHFACKLTKVRVRCELNDEL